MASTHPTEASTHPAVASTHPTKASTHPPEACTHPTMASTHPRGLNTPHRGLYTPCRGLYTPHCGLNTPHQGLYIPRRGLYTPPWPLHTPPWPLHTAVAFIHPTVASTHTTVVLTGRPVGEDVSGIISPGPGAGVSPRLSAVGGLPRPREGQGCFTSLPPWVLWMPLGPEAHTPSAVTGPSTRLAPQPPQALPIGYHLTRYWTVVRVLLVECLQSGFFREALAHV